jgi:hypothetical protein
LSSTQRRKPSQDPSYHSCSLVLVLPCPAHHPILLVLSCSSCSGLLVLLWPARPALSCCGLSCSARLLLSCSFTCPVIKSKFSRGARNYTRLMIGTVRGSPTAGMSGACSGRDSDIAGTTGAEGGWVAIAGNGATVGFRGPADTNSTRAKIFCSRLVRLFSK